MKLVRPGSGPPAEPAAARPSHGGVTPVAGADCVYPRARGNRRAARLRHAGPGRTAYREIR